MILIDFLCLYCSKFFEGELFEPVVCPRCGNFQPAKLTAYRYWQVDSHRRIELGVCKRHSALVPKVGGCPKCLKDKLPQLPRVLQELAT